MQRARRSTHLIGWTLQGFATIAVVLFFHSLMTASDLPLTPGLLTVAGFMGVSGTALIGR